MYLVVHLVFFRSWANIIKCKWSEYFKTCEFEILLIPLIFLLLLIIFNICNYLAFPEPHSGQTQQWGADQGWLTFEKYSQKPNYYVSVDRKFS